MRRCKCCGELSLPHTNRCFRCGSTKLEWEIAARHHRIELIVLVCLVIAGVGALSTIIGHSMIHSGTGPHSWACILLIGGIGFVTASAMALAVMALLEGERRDI